MTEQQAEVIKADTTRMMLTCLCNHAQEEHTHLVKLPDSNFWWKWEEFPAGEYKGATLVHLYSKCHHSASNGQGCLCRAFDGQLSGLEKKAIDEALDEKVRKQKMAMMLEGKEEHLGQRYAIQPGRRVKGSRDGRAAQSSAYPGYEARNLRKGEGGAYSKGDQAAMKEFARHDGAPVKGGWK